MKYPADKFSNVFIQHFFREGRDFRDTKAAAAGIS